MLIFDPVKLIRAIKPNLKIHFKKINKSLLPLAIKRQFESERLIAKAKYIYN